MKNQNSIMPESYEEFISLTLRTRNSKKPFGNARKKLETPMAPAMPHKTCKKSKNEETRSKTNDFKSKFACILEASESTRLRMEEYLPSYHEDHIAGKRRQFTATLQFGTPIYSYASSHENFRSKGSSGQGRGKIPRTIQVRLSFQIDGFLTGLSQKYGNTQSLLQTGQLVR